MLLAKNRPGCFNLEQTGWKYYNTISKKAMEQEFSWSGLFISLSIAFFVVIVSASTLSFINHSIMAGRVRQESANRNVYPVREKPLIELRVNNNIAISNLALYISPVQTGIPMA